MKSTIGKILVGLALPLGLVTAVASKEEAKLTVSQLPAPYVIKIVNPYGETINTLSGKSFDSDPFLIAKDLGVEVYPEDHFRTVPPIEMGIGSQITLLQAPQITLIDGKKKQIRRSWTETVGDFLDEAKIPELGDDDKVNFPLDTKVQTNMQISIVRVAITQVHESQAIDYKVIKKEDKTLDKGKTRVDVKGVKGEKILTYEVRREDGVQVSKKLIKTEVSKAQIDEIQIIGTKPAITVSCGSRSDIKGWILDAGIKYGIDPDSLCNKMLDESRGNPNSGVGSQYQGLFQYEAGFWASASAKAGLSGANISDARAQIYTTAWAWSHGYRGRWPK